MKIDGNQIKVGNILEINNKTDYYKIAEPAKNTPQIINWFNGIPAGILWCTINEKPHLLHVFLKIFNYN